MYKPQRFAPVPASPERSSFEAFSLRNFNQTEESPSYFRNAGKPALEYLARRNGWMALVSVVGVLVIWGLIVRWGNMPAFLLPTPLAVWQKLLSMLSDGSLLRNAWVTLYEVLLGLAFGSLLASGLGYILAKSTLLEKMLSPYLVASQAIPTVAIAPLLVIWFGPGVFSKILICAMIVFFPVLVNTMIGFRAVPENLRDLMRAMRASRWQKLNFLEIPSALPVLFGGLRIGATLSVIGAVVGEFVGSDKGLGFLINVGRGQYDTALVFVSIFTLILMAIFLYGMAMLAERRATRWKSAHRD
jgi:NitT/TauT family transport system permease protein